MPRSTALLEFTVYCYGYITLDLASVLTEGRTNKVMVPPMGLEPTHLSIPEPKSGAATNYAKGAFN